jgi:CRISPR-associated protein Csb2
MFGFRVTYLRGSVTAADIRTGSEKNKVEWPPHPDRLFCALVQAWGDLGEPENGRLALEWMEGIGPPVIHCGVLLSSVVVPRFVPVNDEWNPIGKKGELLPSIAGTLIGRDRKERKIPTATLSKDTVYFWWPDKAPGPKQDEALSELAHAVASLGHPSSLVAVRTIEKDHGLSPSWLPQPGGSESLRVPSPGRLSVLSDAYRAKPKRLRPPVGLWERYGPPVRLGEPARGHHKELIAFRVVGDGPPLPIEATHRILTVWRHAILNRADQPISEMISGHAPESTPSAPRPSLRPHLALLPLPDVGHRFARSHIMGVAAALPGGFTLEERKACLRALGRIEELVAGDLGVFRLERCSSEESRAGLMPETWDKSSRVWGSVTPVVFGRYPDQLWGAEAVHLVRGACEIAGLPSPSEVTIAPVSWVLGTPPSNRFASLQSRPGKPKRAHAHVRLVFAQKVAGPVLVGAGRHQGYGLFRQLDEDDN